MSPAIDILWYGSLAIMTGHASTLDAGPRPLRLLAFVCCLLCAGIVLKAIYALTVGAWISAGGAQ